MFDYQLEHILSYTATLGARDIIGPVPEGLRVNVPVTGGEVTGPKVFGKLRPMGGDWLTIRRDGIAILDVRATIETDDGALIFLTYNGTADRGEDGYERSLQGKQAPSGAKIYISPRFQTADPRYLWINRLHCLGIGALAPEKGGIAYDVYSVR